MKRSAAVATVLGVLILIAILVWQGVGEVARALSGAGWALLLLVPIHGVIVLVNAVGWWVLFPSPRPPLSTAIRIRWLGESVNQLLPVAQVGGEIVKARLMRRAMGTAGEARGPEPGVVGGTVVVAVTVAGATQALFGLMGVGLLLARLGRHQLVPSILAGLGGFALLLGVFYWNQRRGLFGRLVLRMAWSVKAGSRARMAASAAEIDEAVQALYGRRGVVTASLGWYFLAWLLGTAEVWMAMRWLGVPVSVWDALLLESIGQAVRGAAFLIPGALGVQEGTYLALGAFMGLGPGASLALSLAKRARELLLGLPGLAVWQLSEGFRVWRGVREADAGSSR